MDISIFDLLDYGGCYEAKNPPQKAKKAFRSGFFENRSLLKVVQ